MFKILVDANLGNDEIEFKDKDGNTVLRVIGIGKEAETRKDEREVNSEIIQGHFDDGVKKGHAQAIEQVKNIIKTWKFDDDARNVLVNEVSALKPEVK